MLHFISELSISQFGQNPVQSAALIAFLDAVKACSSTSLQTLSFDGITITLAIEKTIAELSTSHGHLAITHGGTGGFKHPKPLQEPIDKLDKYCKENNVILLDLFRSFDSEQVNYLSEEAFRNALKVYYNKYYFVIGFEKRANFTPEINCRYN